MLARKWRPKNFQELRGQEHVSRALVNAIESGRLHHAYLFTGTRGVGKTTIARILSKCLNCEAEGVTATPCGQCGSCSEIDEGRFVDLIEVDAASRTKVDDTRELLENVQYRPTRGRYKVYLIDEVHMLSNSSFNALLKTLEEPPEHVIFLLATTDPQKLPVTVLSRCLQFHLKHMDEATIANHLQFILEQESINFEAPALNLIAQSAEGSMRDALSLLDQAIAYGQGKVLEEDIRTMLGTIDHKFMVRLLEALASRDSVMAIKAVDDMSHYPVDFADALKELLSRLHQVAVYQATQVMLDSAASYIPEFAEAFEAADLQMYYQLGLHARRDLEWAPTAKQGLEMALLRMLAFQIDSGANSQGQSPKKKVSIKAPEAVTPSESRAVTETKKNSTESTQSQEAPVKPHISTNESDNSAVVDKPLAGVAQEQTQPDEPQHKNTPVREKVNSSADDFAAYEQFIQQDDSEEEGYSSYLAGDSEQVSTTSEPVSRSDNNSVDNNPVNRSPSQSNNRDESDNEALASLHSALGLSFSSNSEDTQDSTGNTQQPPAATQKPPALEGSRPTIEERQGEERSLVIDKTFEDEAPQPSDNAKPSQESQAEAESYDSDIERLMQASQELGDHEDSTHQEAPVVPMEVAEKDEEPEFIPELNVPEEAMEWANLVKKLELDGSYHQIAQSSCAIWTSGEALTLELSPEQEVLLTDGAKANVKQSLEAFLGKPVTVEWQLKVPSIETPAQIWQHQAKLRLQKACEDLNQHPFSQQLQQHFGAKIDRQTVTYLND